MTDPQVGVLMLCLFIFTIFLGFPIAFTLIALAVFFGYYAMGDNVFQLLVQRAFGVMSNDVLIAVPLFLFMGYMVERSNILDRLFRSLQVSAKHIPASLAVATLATCALFATATGIVGAVVTLMGLLAFPAMLKAGYDIKLSAGVVAAGGCLGILIPPSIMLILYGAMASTSVVRLYAGAFLPGFLLAGLYMVYVIGRAMLNPKLAPKLPKEETDIPFRQILILLITSFFPLAFLILAVLGAILFGLATPNEAAAFGAFGSIVLSIGYGQFNMQRLKEAVFLTASNRSDGVLALRWFVVVLVGVFISRRTGGDRELHPRPQHDAGHIHAAHPVHHLSAGVAARMDGDHHHLRADFLAVVAPLRHRPGVLRCAWSRLTSRRRS